MAAASNWRKIGAARSGVAPVTTSARLPMAAAACATWLETPSPNRMRVAVANSKSMAAYQPPSGG